MKKTTRLFLFCMAALYLGAACSTPTTQKTPAPSPAPQVAQPAQPVTPSEPPTPVKTSIPEEEPPAQAPQNDQSSSAKALKIVRVLLADNQSQASIKHSGRVYVYTQDLEKKYKVSSPGTLAVRFLGNGKVQAGSLQASQPIIIEPAKDTLLTWNDNIYAGKIFIVPAQNTFLLVEHADLETYLYGVLPYEMSHSWPIEALKAQAVAARTYTLKTIENIKNKYFDLYSDVRSQMYKGGGKQYDSVRTAVDETKSQVLMFNQHLFYTYYHGNCGGRTDDVTSWDTAAKSIKPLSGASCAYDSHSKNYHWKSDIAYSKAAAYAKNAGLEGKLKNIKIVRKTPSGRATLLSLHTSKGTKNVSCNKFRLAVGLKSCKIYLISFTGKGHIHFEGHGYGHGIGMCQDGAYGMAKAGKKYDQILKHYYPGSALVTLEE